MDEFDGFTPGDDPGDGFDADGFTDETGPTSPFDDFEEPDAADDLGEFDGFDTGDDDGYPQAFDVDDDLTETPASAEDDTAPAAEETEYAATYEDMLVADADNPPAFPPELDLDVPEPVDGYPWVDLDTLGGTEAEPWAVNTSGGGDFADADLDDDPAAGALARFWQQ